VGDQIVSIKERVAITVHGRGALSWDSLGRAAAFVTPEDGSVTKFARGLLENYRYQIKGRRIDGDIPVAMLLFEALNVHGIRYAQDASSPYSQLRADHAAIDNIQYPSELLQSRMGDCDDCTVLYCALLENLNIPTALVDAPGHVLMMFDSGVGQDNRYGFNLPEGKYVERDGRFWIPVEVTKLGEGSFLEAWTLGAKTCQRLSAAGNLEVTLVRQAWTEYPYALLTDQQEVQLPDADLLKGALQSNLNGLHKWRERYVDEIYIGPLLENSQNHYRRLALAKTRIEAEGYNDAISALMPLLDTKVEAEALYLIGYAYAGKGQYQDALDYFARAVSKEPENSHYSGSLETLRNAVQE